MNFLDADDDWIEGLRSYAYPRIAPLSAEVGFPILGELTEDQYATTVRVNEEALEQELVSLGFERNPLSFYKSHVDGRKSEGSWRVTSENDAHNASNCDCGPWPEDHTDFCSWHCEAANDRHCVGLRDDRQLHVTLLESEYEGGHVDLYAHLEYDWEVRPRDHLKSADVDAEGGAAYAGHILDEHTYLNTYNK